MTGAAATVLDLAERDYLYGAGPLRLRVDHLDLEHPFPYDGEDWYAIAGMQLDQAGADLRPCQVLVRARCIPPTLRR